MAGNSNAGINDLAKVLSERMQKESESPRVLDFGTIQADLSLKTNTFAIPIPRSDYVVCQSATYRPGSRVLVAWVDNEAVVLDIIIAARNMGVS